VSISSRYMASHADKYSQRTRHGQWMNPAGQADLASIIIPTYNRALLLEEALASATAQTYRPLEIIVVDDGSIDDTASVVNRRREMLVNDSEATVRYCRQSNSGVSSARNHGLIESRGDFIQFLDSDDILNPEKLSLHIACLKRYPGCGYVFSDWARLEDPTKWASISVSAAAEMDSAELYCSPRVKWTMVGMYRRKTCYETGPYCEDMVTGEDKEFNLRVLLATARVVYLPGNLFASRDHDGPRITDAHNVGQNGLLFAVGLHRHMTESAVAEGRLNDPRLVSSLVKGLSGVIVDALEAGRRDLANEAIEICRKMPIGIGRRVRLAIYQILGLLPQGAFPRLWWAWLKIRRAIFEIPKRELRRLGNVLRVGKWNP
jgi:glycosyltransferase involved in cell wall biosynthesis